MIFLFFFKYGQQFQLPLVEKHVIIYTEDPSLSFYRDIKDKHYVQALNIFNVISARTKVFIFFARICNYRFNEIITELTDTN